MSKETLGWLNRNVLRGFTDKRGKAWHWSAEHQGDESNHYPGAIPVEAVQRRLFGDKFIAVPLMYPWKGGLSLVGDVAMVDVRKVEDQVAWINERTGELAGINSDTYNGHQYGEWLVDNVASALGDGLAIASAGLLKGGSVAWVQIEMPETLKQDGVQYRPFIMATTSFDGSIATTYQDGYTDVVCDNTREMFLRERSSVYRIKHTSRSSFSALQFKEAFQLIHTRADEIAEEIRVLTEYGVSDVEWQHFVEAHVPLADDASKAATTKAENKRGELNRLYTSDIRVQPWNGTAWGVVQAVNTYRQHIQTVRGKAAHRFERNMIAAIKGEENDADRAALSTLVTVTGREVPQLVSA